MNKLFGVASLVCLAACGGGDESKSYVALSKLPDGTTKLNGKAVTAAVASGPGSSLIVTSVATDNSAELDVTRSGGNTIALSAAANGSTATVDTGVGGTISGTTVVNAATASGDTVFVLVDQSTNGRNYQNYGFWQEGIGTNNSRIHSGSFGSSADSLPSGAGTATYSGNALGIYVSAIGSPYATVSDVSVNTDFSNVSVTSSGTRKADLSTAFESSASNLDFTSTSTVSGTSFSGTVTGGDVAGTISGEFYGPNGTEVGGVYSTSGTGGTYFGSFGAK